MGELLSLRSYGRAFSRSDGPSFRVNWSEDLETISWADGKMSMDQFRELGARVYDSAVASMSRLMYGLEPQLQLKDIQDRFSAHEYGYSFVQDPANGLRSEYLKLSSRACLDPIDGLVSGERWNFDAVRRYLTEESNLVLLLFQLLFLRAGQGPRTLELSSIECYNGPSTSRGLYVHDGSIVYVTRHAKARQATNREFQVARYACQEDSALLARYLVYVRPFTDMLYRKCDGREQDRRLLFATPDNPDRPWKADVLTKALKNLTNSVCGAAFGVQIYRQLSIAITERHIKSICRPFNRYDDKGADADIEVAFAWQSGHRPIQRGTSYGIDAAYPDSLQPALLRVYRWASREWHRFLKLDYCSGASREPSQRKTTPCKRPFPSAEDNRAPKRLQPSSGSQLISPPPCKRTQHPHFRQTSPHQDSNFIDQTSGVEREPQGVENIDGQAGEVSEGAETDSESAQCQIFTRNVPSVRRNVWSSDAASEIDSDFVPLEAGEAGQSDDESMSSAAYGFRGSFLDLRDLIRSPILGIKHYGKVPTFVTCKDALTALRRLPKSLRSQIREIGAVVCLWNPDF